MARIAFSTLSSTLALTVAVGAASAADSMNNRAPVRHTSTSSTSGSDADINDLRLTVGFLPKHLSSEGQTGNWASNYRFAVTGMRSNGALSDAGGLIYGGEVSLNTATETDQGVKLTENSQMVDGMVGWGYKLAALPAIHFEGTPFFGVGFSEWKVTGGGSANSFTYEYGLRAAGYYTFESTWQVGLDLRYIATHAEPSFNNNSVKFTNQGLAILFSAGKRF